MHQTLRASNPQVTGVNCQIGQVCRFAYRGTNTVAIPIVNVKPHYHEDSSRPDPSEDPLPGIYLIPMLLMLSVLNSRKSL